MKRRLVLTTLAFVLLTSSAPRVQAMEDHSFEAVAADVIVVRPLSFVATLIGSALFVVALPVAAISGSTSETAETLVLKPARMTFTRPIGDMTALVD